MAPGPRLAEAALERFELRRDLARQLVPELREVLLDLRQLLAQRVRVHGGQLRHRLVADFEAFEVELAGGGHEADRGFDRLRLAVAAAEDPLEHAAVLAVT